MNTAWTLQFSERFRQMLEDNTLTQEDLAAELNCSIATVRNYTIGIIPQCLEYFRFLHIQYGVDLNDLIGGLNDDESDNELKPKLEGEDDNEV